MNKYYRFFTAILALATMGAAHSAELSTGFASSNNHNGIMFDVVTFSNALTVTGFDLNLSSDASVIEIYKKSGSFVGSQDTASAWTLVGSATVTSNGQSIATFVDIANFGLDANATTGLYITTTGTGFTRYSNGTVVGGVAAANADLQILEGNGKAYAFGANFSPRVFSGTIQYEVAAVPEPSTWAMMGLGLVGLAFTRRKAKA